MEAHADGARLEIARLVEEREEVEGRSVWFWLWKRRERGRIDNQLRNAVYDLLKYEMQAAAGDELDQRVSDLEQELGRALRRIEEHLARLARLQATRSAGVARCRRTEFLFETYHGMGRWLAPDLDALWPDELCELDEAAIVARGRSEFQTLSEITDDALDQLFSRHVRVPPVVGFAEQTDEGLDHWLKLLYYRSRPMLPVGSVLPQAKLRVVLAPDAAKQKVERGWRRIARTTDFATPGWTHNEIVAFEVWAGLTVLDLDDSVLNKLAQGMEWARKNQSVDLCWLRPLASQLLPPLRGVDEPESEWVSLAIICAWSLGLLRRRAGEWQLSANEVLRFKSVRELRRHLADRQWLLYAFTYGAACVMEESGPRVLCARVEDAPRGQLGMPGGHVEWIKERFSACQVICGT